MGSPSSFAFIYWQRIWVTRFGVHRVKHRVHCIQILLHSRFETCLGASWVARKTCVNQTRLTWRTMRRRVVFSRFISRQFPVRSCARDLCQLNKAASAWVTLIRSIIRNVFNFLINDIIIIFVIQILKRSVLQDISQRTFLRLTLNCLTPTNTDTIAITLGVLLVNRKLLWAPWWTLLGNL